MSDRIAQFSELQDRCTCKEPRTGDRYTNCAEEHEEMCEYRTEVLPMLREFTREDGFTRVN